MPDMRFLIRGIQQQIRAQGKILMIADIDNKPGQLWSDGAADPAFMSIVPRGFLCGRFHQEVLLPEVPNRCPDGVGQLL